MTHLVTQRLQRTTLMVALFCVIACTPALNWRSVSIGDTPVQMLFPCKPDHAARDVVLRVGARDVPSNLSLQGCEAGGMQFTMGEMKLLEGATQTEVLAAWRLASLAPLYVLPADAVTDAWQPKGVQITPPPVRARVMTQNHQVQWMWFAHADRVFQAAVYGKPSDQGMPDAAEIYFSEIKWP